MIINIDLRFRVFKLVNIIQSSNLPVFNVYNLIYNNLLHPHEVLYPWSYTTTFYVHHVTSL